MHFPKLLFRIMRHEVMHVRPLNVSFVLDDLLMQAVTEQDCVRTIIGTAVLITASLMELDRSQLSLVPNINISGTPATRLRGLPTHGPKLASE